ncbi:SbcC/MukB-like Walker B domain-containing protein [Streptomyces sp. NPDC006372]|uniref:SbcC/MukB-like Walker B domain-containing protein n=1 Tax=Streptomyces sp. NPDC006372 TaxID=3155599 RepID=UPI0033B57054
MNLVNAAPDRWARRWHLVGAGVENVWHYTREVLDCPSGRLLKRGANGTGKTTLLEALCPYLLDPVARNLSSGGNRQTSLESLMKGGNPGRRRFGYLWLSFSPPEQKTDGVTDTSVVHYGVRLEYTQGCQPAVEQVFFSTPTAPGADRDDFSELNREEFRAWVADCGGQVFTSSDDYVTDLAQRVFGCGANTLKQIAKRIRKLRNPGLLAGMRPADAELELREVLPRVSPDVVRVTQEALAAAEATRQRYVRAEKTTLLLNELCAAWTQTTARTTLTAVDAALAGARAEQDAKDLAERSRTDAQASAAELHELTAKVEELTVLETETGSRAQALARDAASSDVARARETAKHHSAAHEQHCDLLQAHLDNAQSAVSRLEEAVTAVDQLAASVARKCADAEVPVLVTAPVSVSRAAGAATVIGHRTFGPLPTIAASIDQAAVEETVKELNEARHRQVQRRDDARVLVLAYAEVEDKERQAREVRGRAEEAAERAEQARLRHQSNQDLVRDQVITLATKVQEWAGLVGSTLITPRLDTARIAAQAGAWLEEAEFAGVLCDAAALSRSVTSEVGSSVTRARSRAEYYADQTSQVRSLAEEAAERARRWRSGRLPALPTPAWLEAADETRAFACAVDWNTHRVPPGPARNTLEAVIAATGLLSAELTPEGMAHDGTWMVRPDGPALPVDRSLASVLSAVEHHPLSEVAAAVLRRIVYVPSASLPPDDTGQDRTGLVIGADGTYRTGPVVGRLPSGTGARLASHIGIQARRAAAQREAAAAQRECDRLQRTAIGYLRAAHRLSQFADQVERLADRFPHPQVETASQAEATRAESAQAEYDARTHAARKDRLAQEQEAEHRTALNQWRAQAAAGGLPDTISLARAEAEGAERRAAVLGEAAEEMRGIGRLVCRVEETAAPVTQTSAQVEDSRRKALSSYGHAREAAAALEACRQRSELSELDLEREAEAARQAHQDARHQLKATRALLDDVIGAEAEARQVHVHATKRLSESQPVAEAALARVHALLTVDGLCEALDWPADAEGGHDADWLTRLRSHLVDVKEAPRLLEACADDLRLHLADEAEDGWRLGYTSVPEGVPAHQLTLGGRRFSPPAAAREAAARRAAAQAAYNAADAEALERFILGRIPAAISTAWVELQDWVGKVNGQMALAAASSGVGVQIDVSLRPDLSPSIATIHELTCTVGDADRTPEQQRRIGEELMAVMRLGQDEADRGAPRLAAQADRLAEAVDIRTWVTVKYLITRTDGKQERWGARGVTISQGESRLIVLGPMLAALSAEYRELPGHAARLCALDEVPGEIDEKGRDGIAAYTASLDLDLMCTSHHWDGSPGAWDGIDIYDLEKSTNGIVIASPMHVYTHQLLEATGNLLPQPSAPVEQPARETP